MVVAVTGNFESQCLLFPDVCRYLRKGGGDGIMG